MLWIEVGVQRQLRARAARVQRKIERDEVEHGQARVLAAAMRRDVRAQRQGTRFQEHVFAAPQAGLFQAEKGRIQLEAPAPQLLAPARLRLRVAGEHEIAVGELQR